MSSISVNTITDASGGATTSINGFTPSVSNMAGRNRIINGDMRIDQRNAGASISASGYAVDRWQSGFSGLVLTIQQNAGSVTPPAGFTNYLGVTSGAANTIATGTSAWLRQKIEGYNISDLAWGTADAKAITFSFWVRSSLTGTFGGVFANSAADRAYPFTYTISSANTWEYKTITVAGDTTGTWLTNNGTGVSVYFQLGVGSTYTASAGSWTAGLYSGATGATNPLATNGATFYITGVQLEAGSVATPFCPAGGGSYGAELALCQRYFYKTYNQSVVPGTAGAGGAIGRYVDGTQSFASLSCNWAVAMRTSPTVTLYAPTNGQSGVIQTDGPAYRAAVVGVVGEMLAWAYINGISIGTSTGTQAHFVASAEL